MDRRRRFIYGLLEVALFWSLLIMPFRRTEKFPTNWKPIQNRVSETLEDKAFFLFLQTRRSTCTIAILRYNHTNFHHHGLEKARPITKWHKLRLHIRSAKGGKRKQPLFFMKNDAIEGPKGQGVHPSLYRTHSPTKKWGWNLSLLCIGVGLQFRYHLTVLLQAE